MLEISSEIIDLIEEDNTMDTLLGATVSDSRIYAWNPSEDVVYSSKKSAIFYKLTFGKRPSRWSYPKQFSNGTLFFKVKSIDQTIVNQIAERLITLFDIEDIQTTNWRIATSEILSYNEAIPEGSPTNTQWSKMVTFMLSNIFKRT